MKRLLAILLAWGAGIVAVLLALSIIWDYLAGRGAAQDEAVDAGPFDPFAGGHPVPPLPGQADQDAVAVAVGAGRGDKEELDA